jgi:hypothetical protein
VGAKTYNKLFPLALGVVLGSAPIRMAIADGLQPCDGRAQALVEDHSDDSKGSRPAEVTLSYLDLPGLQTGWGLQIIHSGDRYLLRRCRGL